MYPNMCPMTQLPGCYCMMQGMPLAYEPEMLQEKKKHKKKCKEEHEEEYKEKEYDYMMRQETEPEETEPETSEEARQINAPENPAGISGGYPGTFQGQYPGTIPEQYHGTFPGQYPGAFPGQFVNPDEILRFIEFNNPRIIAQMTSSGIPLPTARQIIRRIIRVSLRFCRPSTY